MGRLRVKELVEVEMLKMVPDVPVEMLVMTLDDNPMVVEVPMRIWLPSPAVKLKPEPRERLPRVVVPIPPKPTPNIPEVIWLALMAIAVLVTPVISPNWLVVSTGTWEALP